MATTTNDPIERLKSATSPVPSNQTFTIAGITTNVFGIEELPEDCTETACLWLLHPRMSTQQHMKSIAVCSINEWNSRRGNSTKGLIAITFDQRNHGSREVDRKANLSWKEGNERHAQDMFSIYRGTAIDTSLLLDHIASYAFPDRPIKLSQNLVLGVSLGGHAVWHVLLHDSRFDTGVAVIGCPDYAALMTDRARLTKLSTYTESTPTANSFIGSKDFPADLLEAVTKYDPAGLLKASSDATDKSAGIVKSIASEAKQKVNTLLGGKRILNQSGGDDKLVPYRCSEPFLRWFEQTIATEKSAPILAFQDRVYAGVGHEFTTEMLGEALEFLCESIAAGSNEQSDFRSNSPRLESKI